jgi:hypothetical protein
VKITGKERLEEVGKKENMMWKRKYGDEGARYGGRKAIWWRGQTKVRSTN